MAIGAIIGLISTVFQVVRAISPPEASQAAQSGQKADRLFAELDAFGRGEIGPFELERAFARIDGKATEAGRLFSKLDADGDGVIGRGEFTASIERLADRLDGYFLRLRAEGGLPPADTGFTREELSGQLAGIIGHFDRADANGDGRVSLREAREYARSGAGDAIRPSGDDQVAAMLQIARLMQAYGILGGATAEDAARKVSERA